MKKMTVFEKAKLIRQFLVDAEKLKFELRHSYLSNGRQESVAEHVWRMALLAMLVIPELNQKPQVEKLIKMILIHDLVEIYAGDIPITESSVSASIKKIKEIEEKKAIEKIKSLLPSFTGEEIYLLWFEYEENLTYEAKIAHALDKIEAQAQHNEAGIETWVEEEYHFAFKLPKYTLNEEILIQISNILIEEVDNMLDDIDFDRKNMVKKI